MADEEITVPMDDAELFRSTMDEAPKEEVSSPPPEEQPKTEAAPERPRDDKGRFIPQTEAKGASPTDAAPTQQQPESTEPTDDQGGQVPSWRLREVREARESEARRADEAVRQAYAMQAEMQAMRAQLAELNKPKPQEPIDFFADPNAAVRQSLDPFQAELQAMRQELAATRFDAKLAHATATYGREAIAEMESAIEKAQSVKNPEMDLLSLQMRNSNDPIGVAMNWHQRNKLMTDTGGDINTYRANLLKDPKFLAEAVEAARTQASGQPNGNSRPTIQLPPSLNKATGSGGNTETLGDDDVSDRGLFRHAMSGPRR